MGELKFPPDIVRFFAGVSKLAELARTHGQIGKDGAPIWQINHWLAFCKGARAYQHMSMFGSAIVTTVHEVEEMLADGYDAEGIHNVLLGTRVEKERELLAASRVAHRMWDPA